MSTLPSWWFNKDFLGATTLSNMMFLAKKEFDSKILDASGNRTTTGVLCEVDVPNGKTFYLAHANAWVTEIDSNNEDSAEFKLDEDDTGANTQVGEIKVVGHGISLADNAISQAPLSSMDLFSEFKGKQIFINTSCSAKKIRLRVSAVTGAAPVKGTIRGWVETNTETPVI